MANSPDIAPSQNTLAKAAGVSRSTVSRVFSNHPGIPAETKKRIRALAEEMGYQKNAIVSMLTAQVRSSRTLKTRSTLAYITSMATADISEVGPNYYEQFLGARQRAEELGYGLDHIWRHAKGMTKERVTKILLSRGIRGLIVAVRPAAMAHISLNWSHFAVAAIGHALPAPRVHFAAASHYSNMEKALRMVGKYGYKRVGYSIWPDSDNYSRHGYASRFCLYQRTVPAKQQVPFFFDPVGRDTPGRLKFERWIKRHRPEALIGVGPFVGIWLKELGMDVPGEISYVDLCLPDESKTVAGIYELPHVVGAMAVELVIEQLHQNALGIPQNPKMVLFEGKWVDGATLPRLR